MATKGTYRGADGAVYRAGRRCWTKREDARVRREFPKTQTAALAAALGRSTPSVVNRAKQLGLKKTAEYLMSPAACRLRRGDNVGAAHRYGTGHVPANKGLRRPGWSSGRMKETQFKKGNSTNRMPIGSRRLIDGYIFIKLGAEPFQPYTRNWYAEHILDWEIANRRQLPAGHALAFKNGDRTDIRLENLELITRAQLMRRNTVHNLPPPIVKAIQLIGAVKRQIRRRDRADHRRPA